MRYAPFHSNLTEFRKAGDSVMVKDILLSEISDAVVNRKEAVIDAINRSGMFVDSSTSEEELSKIVIDNLGNKKFVKGLSSVIALKTPDDFNSFSSVNGNKATKDDYVKDIYFSVDGNVKSDDENYLSDKVNKLLIALGLREGEMEAGHGGWAALGILALSGTAIYFIAIRPMGKINQ